MILTCPRCATRYLVDDDQLWTTGRTVQCDACGRRWRATGSGERGATPADRPAPLPSPAAIDELPPVAVFESEFAPVPSFVPLEPPPSIKTAPESALFLQAPRRSASPGNGPAGLGRALAILFLAGMVVAILVLFQDVIVRAAPALAPLYSALGLSNLSREGAGAHG